MSRAIFFFLACMTLFSCETSDRALFTLIPASKSGVDFKNFIYEDEEINIVNQEYLYNGGGVAAGDFNNDGLTDLFFTGNMVDNQLYINKGNFKFENISEYAGIQGAGRWKSGVAVIDINNDNLLDIYVCASIDSRPEVRKNQLYVNQGVSQDGKVKFTDQAEEYGIADDSYTSNAAFLDYDNDGDQDLYLLINSKQLGVPTTYREKVLDGSSDLTDKLFRNDGDGNFTDVSKEAGILVEGHGLGISILDINKDGWLDIYIANDFLTNDVLYVNHEGVFKDEIDLYFKHQSKFSMGTDAADINNDGHQDVITVDMMPKLNNRKKTVIQAGMYINYINDSRYDYTHQYTRNMLQVSNEDGSFRETGLFSGVEETEWSWSPLLADFDNDGYRDLMITNGFPKDLTDKDFINFRMKINRVASPEFLDSQMPSVKVPNFAYKNNGDNTFIDVSEEWGMTQPSFSNGAVYADLDNDGDLDYVVNNIYDEAFLYRNNLDPQKNIDRNYLRVNLQGAEGNYLAAGSKLALYYGDSLQIHEHSVYRGYISSVEKTIHFGLGKVRRVDSLVILWPDLQKTIVINPAINSTIAIRYEDADKEKAEHPYLLDFRREQPLVRKVDVLDHKQEMYDVVDFSYQQTIPHKFSQYGPALAVGDITGDGLEDLIIGGFEGEDLTLKVQNANGSFTSKTIEKEGAYSDGAILIFDADGDEDLDVYVVSAGFQESDGSEVYRDRLYRNQDGRLVFDASALPEIAISGSVARACDFDNDGDLDIFVGGRIVPHNYPIAPRSYILVNENGSFQESNIDLSNLGMVTDALWSDIDNDNDYDLMVTSEFKPIQVLINEEGSLTANVDSGLENYKGWWQSIIGEDFDRDGDIDFVVGNFGLNNPYNVSAEHPMFVYALDIDNNNSIDPVLACYNKFEDGSYQLCPVNFWEELSAQSPVFRRRFKDYQSYGNATIDSVLTSDEIERSVVMETNFFESSYLENLGNGTFSLTALPLNVQIAPIAGMIADYIDEDEYLDIMLIGNDYGNEVSTGTLDALNGMILLGDGAGNFLPQGNGLKGFKVPGDGKALVHLVDNNSEYYIASQNKDSILVFAGLRSNFEAILVNDSETSATIEFEDGMTSKKEFFWGSGFLSQSSRNIKFTDKMKSITFYSGNRQTRKILKESLSL